MSKLDKKDKGPKEEKDKEGKTLPEEEFKKGHPPSRTTQDKRGKSVKKVLALLKKKGPAS